ncbi:hypothetical protein [Marinomonas lutimaris]|nr:hypothetical protein [Marinomonas lutimaris]
MPKTTMQTAALTPNQLGLMDRYWRASNQVRKEKGQLQELT